MYGIIVQSMKIETDLYTATDIERLLGINATRLYHWVQTKRLLKPEIEGIGRGKSNEFNIDHLATLSLIKLLTDFRLDLSTIKWTLGMAFSQEPMFVKKIVRGNNDSLDFYGEKGEHILAYGVDPVSTWQIYKVDRPLFISRGLVLKMDLSFNPSDKEHVLYINIVPKGVSVFEGVSDPPVVSCLLVDLIMVIRDIEKRTGRDF